ncbi:MAG: DNA internalization-related competence protein ComEC/Rec2 [Anaerolineae bacterium]|nr:DNA internalization-related competence protein ComEC/Rec2 [Anaerolineae bacterium]
MIIVYIGICWLIGIALTQFIDLDLAAWSLAALASLVAAIVFQRSDKRIALLLVCLCSLTAGAARAVAAQPTLDSNHVAIYNDTPRAVTLIGTVVEPPVIRDRSIDLRVAVDEIAFRDGTSAETHGTILVTTFRFPVTEYGTQLQIQGKLQTPPESYDFNYKEYLALEGIHSVVYLPAVDVLAAGQGNPLLHAVYAFKDRLFAVIGELLPNPQAGVLAAELLGDDSGIPEHVVEDFRTVGLSHLLVVSGFHVAIVTLIVVSLSEPLLGRRGAVYFTSAVLVLYMIMVGAEPSVVRATIMGIAYLIGTRLLGRPQSGLASLLVAAILMTAINPLVLWGVGFQLSFAATLGLILYARPLDGWMRRMLLKRVAAETVDGWPGLIVRVIVASLSAQILTIPLVVYYFQQFSTVSLLANVLVMPFQPLIIMLGALTALLGLIFIPAAQVVAWVVWLFLTFTISVTELLSELPFASVPAQVTPLGLAVIYTIIGVLTWVSRQEMERREQIFGRIRANFTLKAATTVSVIAALLVLLWGVSQPDGKLHIAFLDVGQGDATLIITPSGRQILIDGGYYPTLMASYLGRYLPFWDKDIDMLIATHPDADHISGLPSVFDRYDIGQLVTYGAEHGESDIYDELLDMAEENDVPQVAVRAGETIIIEDGVRLEVVHPGEQLSAARNDNSVSLRLVYGDFTTLLSADAEEKAELEMVESGLPLQAIVFKGGHHGSRTSSTLPFLQAVQPQIAVISSGEGNKFGHPHSEALERYAQVGATVLRTDELGTIEVITDGAQMWWEALK